MRVYFLRVEQDSGERRGEVERGIGGVICGQDKGVCECRGGECGGEEGFVVNIRRIVFFGGHRGGLRLYAALAIGLRIAEYVRLAVFQAVVELELFVPSTERMDHQVVCCAYRKWDLWKRKHRFGLKLSR